jgi:penicillin amidase
VKKKPAGLRGRRLALRVVWLLLLALCPIVIIALGFFLYVQAGVGAGAVEPAGTLGGLPLRAPVRVARDARGIPHVRAQNEHDLYFAEGYLQGTDRLFQLDLYRRLVAGRLSEIFGAAALDNDLAARTYDVKGLIAEQERALSPDERVLLQAFSAGINAAIRTRPLPPEFRALGYRPEPWSSTDSLLASFSTVLALTDSWDDVLVRSDVADALGQKGTDAFFPITDPQYDSPTTSRERAPVAPLPPLSVVYPAPSPVAYDDGRDRAGSGSNEFVAGAGLTTTHRALLGNDPHLSLRMPGIWYLADLGAPGIHVAGATLVGAPGIILGHTQHVAWGATNGSVATVEIYRERFRSDTSDEYLDGNVWTKATHRSEKFLVRWGQPVVRDYLRTRHGFVFATRGEVRFAAAWSADLDHRSALTSFAELDRAASVADVQRALESYPGPPQNFVFADDSGKAGYVLAGAIPLDPLWALRAHDGPRSGAPIEQDVPFSQLPQVAASRSTVAFTANDRVYGRGYPYRLTAYFEAPYRAASIARHLATRPYSPGAFSAIQADVRSFPERDLAAATVAAVGRTGTGSDPDMKAAATELAGFDGRFVESSRGALYAWQLRRSANARLIGLHLAPELAARYLQSHSGLAVVVLLRALRERPHGWVPADDYDAFLLGALHDAVAELRATGELGKTWGEAGRRVAHHPLAGFGWHGWDGTPFPGRGSAYSPHVMGLDVTQSFRAVWDVGNWEAGGIVIPQGESGEPGSVHYRDLAPAWLAEKLVAFPFDDPAVALQTASTFQLTP